MADFSLGSFNVNELLTKYLLNPVIWFGIVILFVFVAFGILYIRKRRKYIFSAAEVVDLGGQGKTNINFIGKHGAGWFGKKQWFFKLLDSGEKVMRDNKGNIIEEFSEEDFQEVNGQRGVIFYRDPIRRLLFPINKMKVENKHLVTSIAPASYTDTALDIIKSNEKETTDFRDRIMQIAIWALVIIFSLLAIIMIIQMVNQAQDKAAKLLVDAGKVCLENAKEIYGQVASMQSNAP